MKETGFRKIIMQFYENTREQARSCVIIITAGFSKQIKYSPNEI
jgi:hypothetical protein